MNRRHLAEAGEEIGACILLLLFLAIAFWS